MLKYLLDWSKDLIVPETDLTKMSMALPTARESRTWCIGLCLQSVGRDIS